MITIEASRTKLTATLASSIILFAVSLLLWMQQSIDHSIVISCNAVHVQKGLLEFFTLVSRYGMGLIALLFSGFIALSLKRESFSYHLPIFMYVLIAFAAGSIAGDLLKEFVGRARPVVELAGLIAQTQISDSPSFPSGHAAKSMSMALSFLIMARTKDWLTGLFKLVTVLLAILVCCSRVALQKHFPSDVIAGTAVALLFAFVAVFLINVYYKKRRVNEALLVKMNQKYVFIFLGLAVVLAYI
ncbi:phosphatase PAP2 family protein [bacterium]|nr:MAG: phosphatase PAP2 family protein [bacterium]